MSLELKKKDVKERYYYIIPVGYCDLQYLLNRVDKVGYTARVEGWASDIFGGYEWGGVCISTGYAPICQNIERNDALYKIIKKYNNKIRNQKKSHTKYYYMKQIDAFIGEVLKNCSQYGKWGE